MKPLLRLLIVIGLTASLREALAQDLGSEIQILATFDYPGDGLSTIPLGMNDAGVIVGKVSNSRGGTRGFIRFADGSFSAPIDEPTDHSGFFTVIHGINNSELVCGFSVIRFGLGGFFATAAGFTEFQFPGAASTEPEGLNDAGDFCGGFSNYFTGVHFESFLSIGGTFTTFRIRDASTSFATDINNAGEVVGLYLDSSFNEHGFFRDAAGRLTAPIDLPGAAGTLLNGLNDQDLIVGSFYDDAGVQRGFVLQLPDTFVILDIADATLTSLNGITNSNLMCGRWEDSAGIGHGLIAQITGD
jgi:hypothetical protein